MSGAAGGSQESERDAHSPQGLWAPVKRGSTAFLLAPRSQTSTQLLAAPENREGLAPGTSSAHPALRIEVRLWGGLPGTQAMGEKGRGSVLSASQGTSSLSPAPTHLPITLSSPCNFLSGGGGKEMSRMMD